MKGLQIYQLGKLFEDVQLNNLLGDGKTFPDCIPKRSLSEIKADFDLLRDNNGFDLKNFVLDNFQLPPSYSPGFKSDRKNHPEKHIDNLWNVLTRKPEKEISSIIPLPHPYVVPGGRFREIYYWDSYFTMVGLRASGRFDLIQNMIDNFAWLIDQFGYIPNGNRTYFLGRSQPPFFSLMTQLLAEKKGETILQKYLPQLEKEYDFWMRGTQQLSATNHAAERVVRMEDGSLLNRYWDASNTPRPEAYKEDIELSHQSAHKPEILYRHLRAAAESGWDFSSRWFRDSSFSSIHTTDIIPVDLNCLLYHLERSLAEIHKQAGNQAKASFYVGQSTARRSAIRKFCWNEPLRFFFDFDFIEQKSTDHFTLAAAFPLFFEVATPDQTEAVATVLEEKFLKPGGLTTTLNTTGQQWDAPNGWAPLQWIAYKGLMNYGFEDLAGHVKEAWLNTNTKVYRSTGKMTEKYDVWNADGAASGGEYPNQDGFGWTNGVFLGMAGG